MLRKFQSKGIMVLAITLLSSIYGFVPSAGGEGYEIYLNNKLVLQRFGNQMNAVQALQLDSRNTDDQLVIKYHHCGKVGKNRVVTIRNEQNKILKEWKFSDSKTALAAMSCSVKEILALEKSKSVKLNLYYTSSELPAGRQLVAIQVGQKSYASR